MQLTVSRRIERARFGYTLQLLSLTVATRLLAETVPQVPMDSASKGPTYVRVLSGHELQGYFDLGQLMQAVRDLPRSQPRQHEFGSITEILPLHFSAV